MKKLLFMIGIGAMTTTAAPLVEGGLSTSGQEAVEAYNTVEIYMQETARVLGRIQDKATADAEAPLLKRIVTELKNAMAAMLQQSYALLLYEALNIVHHYSKLCFFRGIVPLLCYILRFLPLV